MALTKKQMKADEELLKTLRTRFTAMTEADQLNRQEAMIDMKFINVPGKQWEQNMKKGRGNRPCYEFNKLRVTAKRIINDMKANPAQGKVRGVEGSDKKIAAIIEGLTRNIWNTSNADAVIDYASEYQVSAGMGAWRIVTEFSTDTAFEQDIKIEGIPNPFCLYADNNAKELLKEDADDWILTEKISKKEFEKQWPKAEVVNFEDTEFDDDEEWEDDEKVRIAEYWYKVPTTKELLQLVNGQVIDAATDEGIEILKQPEAIKNRRTVKTNKIMMVIANGRSILEAPTEWAGTMFPFIMIFGEYIVIDGRVYWYGIGRWGKDAQRSYNISRTAISETIAGAPLSTIWATPEQIEGHVDEWKKAHKENMPFRLFNADPKAPGAPSRTGGADVPIALIQESQIASEEINMVTGIFAADVGEANQASSGRQEIARQQQGSLATFNYPDNRGKGIQRTWDLLIDLIPKIYDTERELRIIGPTGEDDYKMVNTFVKNDAGEDIKNNDLSLGRYDAVVTLGPSWSTRRQEASEVYGNMFKGNELLQSIASDLWFKAMDLPFSEEIAERMKAMLPPEIQSLLGEEDQQIPAEVQIMMQQAEQAMNQVEQLGQQVQQAAQEVNLDKAEVEKLTAELETKQAKFEAQIAKEVANLAKKGADLVIQEVNINKEEFIQDGQQLVDERKDEVSLDLAKELAASVEVIQNISAQFAESAVQTINQIQATAEARPKVVRVDAVRKDGKLSAIPVFESDEVDKTLN